MDQLTLLIIPILLLFLALFFIFWLLMLIDAVTREFDSDTDKVVWVLVIIFTNIIGALVYYFALYKKYKSLKWFWLILLGMVVFFFIVLIVMVLFFGNGSSTGQVIRNLNLV